MDQIILLLGLLLIVGVIMTKFSSQLGVPALVLFIIVGMAIGVEGLGLITFTDFVAARNIAMLAFVIILFDGGLQTKWSVVKPIVTPATILATLGVIITSLAVGVGAKFILDVSWVEGMLFGALVGSTDAAAVFAVLKGKNIQPKIKSTLEFESASNDPMAMILMITFMTLLQVNQQSFVSFISLFLWQLIVGVLMGIIGGKITATIINRINLDSSGLYPVLTIALVFLIYSVTDLINASGILAVYVSGIIIGNSDILYQHSIFRFTEGFGWMAQILLFTLLGLLVLPTQVFTTDIVVKGLLLSLILIFLARPLAVFLCTIKMGYSFKELLFLCWAGLKGAVPIVLATFPMAAGIENRQLFFNCIFFIVLISTLVQGSTIKLAAEKLGLTLPPKPEPSHSLELISTEKANVALIDIEVNPDAAIIDHKLSELNLPKDTLVNAIIRNNELIPPSGETVIKSGDILYILTSVDHKSEVKKLFSERNEQVVGTTA